jgi:putative transferase (TIGR04331 family)
MSDQPRHLIISSDISTWKFDQPVLFLGKWCLREQDKSIWEKMDAVIAEPIGAEPHERHFLHFLSRKIESELFPTVVTILNDYHGVEHHERYWKIVIGHWFREAVQLLLNRIETLDRCLNQYPIKSITIMTSSIHPLAAREYSDIWSQCLDDSWNSLLYAELFKRLQNQNCVIEYFNIDFRENVPIVEPHVATIIYSKAKKGMKQALRRFADKSARKLARKMRRENDAFIINSYLPPESELLLNLALGQFPQRRTTVVFEQSAKVDHELRAFLCDRMEISEGSKIERLIASLLFTLIPVNYLEGFAELKQASDFLEWPKKPKFIFTSNNFAPDEIFKVWTAGKVNEGVPYIVGQHGTSYGTNKFYENTIEEVTSDKFLTWGWERGLSQHVPAFIFKNASGIFDRNSKGSQLLLIESSPMARLVVWDQADEFSQYIAEQFVFVSSLEGQVKEKLLIRLYSSFKAMKGEEDLRWRNFDQSLKLDSGAVPIRELWKESRLIVHSYDSTGLLETLEANVPTLAFWQNGLIHLVDEAIPYYEILISAGIVHLTPESAANKVNEVWGDVENWWQSSEVQSARTIFCHEYARTSKKPIRELKRLLAKDI